jgi:hypothetical protein
MRVEKRINEIVNRLNKTKTEKQTAEFKVREGKLKETKT